MTNIELTDTERLEEVGRILALGAIRVWREKTRKTAKKALAGGPKAGLIVRDGEKSEDQKRLPDDPERTFLN